MGDYEFQKKCLAKMDDVSHNMDAILRLCSRAILLQSGCILENGTVQSVVTRYTTNQLKQPSIISFKDFQASPAARRNIHIVSVVWPSANSANAPWVVPFGEPISFLVHFRCVKPVQKVELGISLNAPTGTEIASTSSIATRPDIDLAVGDYTFSVTYRSLNLVPGAYSFGMGFQSNMGMEDYIPKAFSLDVTNSDKSSLNKTDTFWGYVVPDVEYELIAP